MGGGGGAWGSITGTLSTQTDLQTALDAKQTSISNTPSDDITIASYYSRYFSGLYEIENTKYLEISEFSTLEIG